jgi:hypothetical protein
MPTLILFPAATTAAPRPIRTNRRIEEEKRLNAGRWFGIRALNPVCWLFDQWNGSRKTAYSVERECDAAFWSPRFDLPMERLPQKLNLSTPTKTRAQAIIAAFHGARSNMWIR